jgi:hypothetical protein
MKTVLATVMPVALAAGTLSMASAADDKKLTPQQEQMKACNTQAADKKGDERKAFMSGCLKAGAPAAPMTQQEKMKTGVHAVPGVADLPRCYGRAR